MQPVGTPLLKLLWIFISRFGMGVIIGTLLLLALTFTRNTIQCGDPFIFPDRSICQRTPTHTPEVPANRHGP
ncbi:hypothetical protein [Ruegeria sp.]|uniref:hypothetical protein n=1 Tax=Ruegeria sp. TaxID=1879320 RepID=UPI003B007589